MELLRDIAHISGKSGLYRILKPGRGGVIVETLDEKKQKEMVSSNARVSVLKDISVYMANHQDNAIPLGDIFLAIREKHGEKVEIKITLKGVIQKERALGLMEKTKAHCMILNSVKTNIHYNFEVL